jgi:hypothetical protein
MILLWGQPEEAPLAEVREALGRAGAEVALFDERRALNATVRFSAESADAGELRVDGHRIELEAVGAAYFRPYGADSSLDRVELSRREAVARRVGDIYGALWAWADITRAFVLNRPTLMASNASKPLQAQMLSACGFETPVTLATTDAGLARAFIAMHRDVIYKSISGTRSIVARLDAAKAARLDALCCCPVQFQEYVPGVDVRVHVVGDAMFACELQSEADDYRYSGRSGQTTTVTAIALPPDIAALCRHASVALGLPLCGIDLRRTPEGRWVAFEVNPSPGYTYFASASGAPIADAIAALLMRGAAH